MSDALNVDQAFERATHCLNTAETETDRELMEQFRLLGETWINYAGTLAAIRADTS